MKTAKQIFEEELSGEPLTQESVIEAIKIAREEIYMEVKDKLSYGSSGIKILLEIFTDDNFQE